jgi:uncharacterized membrane protein
MSKGRMEAFSDGVLAIIITIMVLELKIPHHDDLDALTSLLPVILSYILSFIHIGIYWNNHHHMLQRANKVNGPTLWANLHLLFWLSLLPFVTGWMGENNFTKWPTICYGFVLMMAGIAYYILAHGLTFLHGKQSEFSRALGSDRKGILSIVTYAFGIALSFLHPLLGIACYTFVALMWIVPDKRFEMESK